MFLHVRAMNRHRRQAVPFLTLPSAAAPRAHLGRHVLRQARHKHVAEAVCPGQRVVVEVQGGGDVAGHDVVSKHVELVVALLVPAAGMRYNDTEKGGQSVPG